MNGTSDAPQLFPAMCADGLTVCRVSKQNVW